MLLQTTWLWYYWMLAVILLAVGCWLWYYWLFGVGSDIIGCLVLALILLAVGCCLWYYWLLGVGCDFFGCWVLALILLAVGCCRALNHSDLPRITQVFGFNPGNSGDFRIRAKHSDFFLHSAKIIVGDFQLQWGLVLRIVNKHLMLWSMIHT